MKKGTVAAASLICLFFVLPQGAQGVEDLPTIGWKTGLFDGTLFPSLDAGTHYNRFGLLFREMGRFESGSVAWGAGAFASAKVSATNLGIPGSGATASCGLDALIGFGPSATAPAPWTDFALRRSSEFRYEWIAYWDTWGTAQFNGRIEYVKAIGGHSWGVTMQDDLFSPPLRDQFRTGAAEISYGFRWDGVDSALGFGTKIWTGSTYGSEIYHRGQVIVMNSSLPGVNDSAGVLYLACRRGAVRLELGWDSEAIRNVLQNGLHWLINDGIVPLVDRPDRPYVLFTLYPDGDLY